MDSSVKFTDYDMVILSFLLRKETERLTAKSEDPSDRFRHIAARNLPNVDDLYAKCKVKHAEDTGRPVPAMAKEQYD